MEGSDPKQPASPRGNLSRKSLSSRTARPDSFIITISHRSARGDGDHERTSVHSRPPSVIDFRSELKSEREDNSIDGNDDERGPLLQHLHSVQIEREGQDQSLGPPKRYAKQITFAMNLSWFFNVVLLACKAYAYGVSHSKAVLASLADSAVDLVSQAVIAYAEYKMKKSDPRFPVGKARLEAIGVLTCACIMSAAAFGVIQSASVDLYEGFAKGNPPILDMGMMMYIILGVATACKIVCYIYCRALQDKSDSMAALAEDHLNDVMSNTAAIVTAAVASLWTVVWWVDPVGAILISLCIVWRWAVIAIDQVDKIVGRSAPDDFIRELTELANAHHDKMFLDVLRAYHFGARYIVEMEVVMPPDTSLREAHDASLELQDKVEALEEVERAFVHVDYQVRDAPEHKTERLLTCTPSMDEDILSPISTLLSPTRAQSG